jgi:hypothetical protein
MAEQITYQDISNLLGFQIAEEVFNFLPIQSREGPVMVLPGHLKNSILQVYLNAVVRDVDGLKIFPFKQYYCLMDLDPINVRMGANYMPVDEKSASLHIGNHFSEPCRSVAIATPEFVNYLEKHALYP